MTGNTLDLLADGVRVLRPDWPAPAAVQAAVTTRYGGVSQGAYASMNLGTHVGDDPQAVAANRRVLRHALSLPEEPVWLRQVHGTDVVMAEAAAQDAAADAAYSAQPGRVCVVMTADCLPVFFCDRTGTRVAVAHAGWRGLVSGVLEATIRHMGVPAGELLAWLGPAIGPLAFEVGGEVRQAFVGRDKHSDVCFVPSARAGHYLADIYALARRRLHACGLSEVSGGGLCTYGDAESFFSYRRDGDCGRMASLIWLV